MVSGFDRYFQIVKCFRDEDLRKDRQPEFTQIDIEMSFVEENDVIEIANGLIKTLFLKIIGEEITLPIRKMTYKEAFETYGTDKPDLRFDMRIQSLNSILAHTEFKVIKDVLIGGGNVACLVMPGGAEMPRNRLDKLIEETKSLGARGLAYLKYQKNQFVAGIAKFFSAEELKNMADILDIKENDLVLMVADRYQTTYPVLGQLRLMLAEEFGLIDKKRNELPSEFEINQFESFDVKNKLRLKLHDHSFFYSPSHCLDKRALDTICIDAYTSVQILSIKIHKPHNNLQG